MMALGRKLESAVRVQGMAKPNPRVEEAKERREREDLAPGLLAEVPYLKSLRIEFFEERGGRRLGAFARPVVLAHAAAFLEVPCGDEQCRYGGHQLTSDLMQNVKARVAHFSGSDPCRGDAGSVPCSRVLHYSAKATYTQDVD